MGAAYRRAVLLFGQRQYDLARKELANEVAAEPENGRAFALWAFCDMQCNDLAAARQKAERGIGLSPSEHFTHYALAYVFSLLKLHIPAERSVREALRIKPRDADYLSLLAWALYGQRNLKGAIESARQALALNPRHVESHRALAIALRDSGEPKAALSHATQALAIEPENIVAHLTRGEVLREVGEHDQAHLHFTEAMCLDPNSPVARERFVEALRLSFGLYRIVSRMRIRLFAGRVGVAARVVFILMLMAPSLTAIFIMVFQCRIEVGLAALAIASLPIVCILGWSLLFDWIIQFNPVHRHAISRRRRAESWIFAPTMIVCYASLTAGLVCHRFGHGRTRGGDRRWSRDACVTLGCQPVSQGFSPCSVGSR